MLTRISILTDLSHLYVMKEVMISQDNNRKKSATRKFTIVALALIVVLVVLLNVWNYFLS